MDLLRRLYPVSSDDEVVLTAKLSANAVEGGPHLPGNVPFAEISDWLIAKRILLRTRTESDWSFNSCHD